MKSHEVKISRKNLVDAREKYLDFHTTLPEQICAKFSEEDGWTLEFHAEETCWNEGFVTCISGESVVTKILISCDQDHEDILQLQLLWDNDWNHDKEIFKDIEDSTDEQKEEILSLSNDQKEEIKKLIKDRETIYYFGDLPQGHTREDLKECFKNIVSDNDECTFEEFVETVDDVEFYNRIWLDCAIKYVKQSK